VNVLFVYRYLGQGGVESVLRARLEGLGDQGIASAAWFLQDLGGAPWFRGLGDRVRVGDRAALSAHLAAHPPDLVTVIDTAEVWSLLAPGMPAVFEAHSAYPEALDILRRLPARERLEVWVPSAHQAAEVAARLRGPHSVRVVPNPLHRSLVAPIQPLAAVPRRPVVAWVGRFDELKNWREFVQLGGGLVRGGRLLELWMAGGFVGRDGGEELLRAARTEGALGVLRWWRYLPHSRMAGFFDAVRESGGVVVTTSRRESFGMTVAEAMARGCAVVVPDRPPFSELVTAGESGLRCGAPQAAARAVERLLSSPELRHELGARARESVLERFAPAPALAALASALRAATQGAAEQGSIGRPAPVA
jgi:glycosyltransferase involved in cell wall biosynthesis